jgi:hypothetical protein
MELFAGFILLSGLLIATHAVQALLAANARRLPWLARALPGLDQPGTGFNFESESQRELRRVIARLSLAEAARRPIAVPPAPVCQP